MVIDERIIFRSKKDSLTHDKRNILKINLITIVPLIIGIILILIRYGISDNGMNICIIVALFWCVVQIKSSKQLLDRAIISNSGECANEMYYIVTEKDILSFDEDIIVDRAKLNDIKNIYIKNNNIIIETNSSDIKIIKHPTDIDIFIKRVLYEINKNSM